MSDHAFGVPRGTIEEPAHEILRGATPNVINPEQDQRTVQLALLHSIATSLMRIADRLEVER